LTPPTGGSAKPTRNITELYDTATNVQDLSSSFVLALKVDDRLIKSATMTQQLTSDPTADPSENKPKTHAAVSALAELCWAEESLESLFEKVEHAKQEWETTVDSLPELICLVDAEGRIVRANRTIEAWGLGLVTAIRGQSLHALVHPDCVSLFCALDRFLHQAIKQAREGQLRSS
jgi:PAS domain-containing protein